MAQNETDNRREHRRILVSKPATVRTEDDEFTGRILNISAGGAGICMDVRLMDKTRITVNIENFGLVPAKVVRQMQDGIGVKFEMSEEKEKRFIEQITDIVEKKREQQNGKTA